MNFNEWYNKEENKSKYTLFDSQAAWNSCREEVLKIIFLNTKVNGKHHIDFEKLLKEIQEL